MKINNIATNNNYQTRGLLDKYLQNQNNVVWDDGYRYTKLTQADLTAENKN